ncbi:hypothetical protein [Variovorax rhizosphaerae]|uniref:Uncharacterized protein n=1 Tax=Variovorax rhizosphaerae TaxID=1836200 RepID=A0ABU8WUV5_9BURK
MSHFPQSRGTRERWVRRAAWAGAVLALSAAVAWLALYTWVILATLD